MVKKLLWRNKSAFVGARTFLSQTHSYRNSNRPRSQQHCVYFSQHVGQVKPGCIWIKSYQLISGLFQVILSDLLLKWVSVFVPVLVALHNQFMVNEIQINPIFAHNVLPLDIESFDTFFLNFSLILNSRTNNQRMNRCDNNMSPPKMERFFVNEIISDGSVGK